MTSLCGMFLAFLAIIFLSNDSIFVSSAIMTPVRSPRVPLRAINTAGDSAPSFPSTPNSNPMNIKNNDKMSRKGNKGEMPDINMLVDHAEFALNSYLPSSEILKTLRRTKTNVRIIQRNLDNVGASYNIIQYSDKISVEPGNSGPNSTPNPIRWVISIPGSRNQKNMQQNMDNKLVIDEVLNIKVHRGYKTVYRAILADFIQEEKKMRRLFGRDSDGVTEIPKSRISLSVTGHSLGGAVSCLLAAALQTRGYNIEHVTVFGTPKFTDKKGAALLVDMLPIGRVEHVRDPVSISPMGMPMPFPFAENYADLESEALLVLEPAKITEEKDKKEDNDISISLLVSVLQNPLSALSEFNWRGERMMEQLQKHKVYAGREAMRRTGILLRMGDVFSVDWQWHSMRAYHMLLKEHQAEYGGRSF